MEQETVNKLGLLLNGDPEAGTEAGRTGFLKTAGLSVEQFAYAIGVTRTSVYYYIKDKKRPTLATLKLICDKVGITLAEGVEYCSPRTTGRQIGSHEQTRIRRARADAVTTVDTA